MNVRNFWVLVMLGSLLAGCASYTYNNEKFRSAEDAYASQKVRLDSIKGSIAIVSPTINGSLLVIAPSKTTFAAVGITRKGSPGDQLVEYVARISATDAEYMAQYFSASKAFSSVDGRVSDYPLKDARKESDKYTAVLYLHMLSPSQIGWYLLTPTDDEPIQVNFDATAAPGPDKINSLIANTVKAYRGVKK
jgi:hypothetical protein